MFEAIAQMLIMSFRPKKTILNSQSYIKELVTKAVEYGFMLAMSETLEFNKTKKYW